MSAASQLPGRGPTDVDDAPAHVWMKNSVDPDQLASDEASWSGPTLFSEVGTNFWKKNHTQSALITFDYGKTFLEGKTLRLNCTEYGISSVFAKCSLIKNSFQ